jgi:hypothetical protein
MTTSESRNKARDRITAQANGGLTAPYDPTSGSYTGGATTTINNTYSVGTENGRGADYLVLELDVTTAPAASSSAEIWWRGSNDSGTKWTKWKYSHTIADSILLTTADFYDAQTFWLKYNWTELKVVAVDSSFTSTLYATPKLIEAQ